jgi:outer membrane protein TolC
VDFMFSNTGRVARLILSINIVALSFSVVPAAAQQRLPLTIAEAGDLALAGEPGATAFLDRADALQEQAVAAGQLPDPVMRIGLANFPIDGGGFTTEGMTQAQLGVRQAFPRARTLESDQFRSQARAMSFSADARNRDVLLAARHAWLDTYYAQRAESLLTEARPFFADLVTITRSLYSVGRKSQHDVLRADLELSRLDDRLIETRRVRETSRASLSRWLGQEAQRPLAMKLPAWETLPALEQLREQLATHPALAAADADLGARQAAVRVAEERKKPGWALDVGYGYRDGYLPSGEPRSDFVSVAVTVDLPLFSGDRQDRRLAAALSHRRAAINTQAELTARLASELAVEYARWLDLSRRLELYETRILDQSRSQAQAALLAYQSDAGDFADVMRAYIDDLNARLEHVRLQVDRAKSYAVLANLGGLGQ